VTGSVLWRSSLPSTWPNGKITASEETLWNYRVTASNKLRENSRIINP
jgi:hypothetical protein